MTTPSPIPKVAREAAPWRRPIVPFASARAAFRAFLERVCDGARRRVLLPAYIGWSPREGSGVYDPVCELALPAAFYRVDASLRIDLDHLNALLRAEPTAVVVLIHYFGYRDRDSDSVARLAAQHGALLLEDEAHAMLTDLVGGTAGRLGAACIYSLHKLLPVPSGGALVLNPGAPATLRSGWAPEPDVPSFQDMDLARMAAARVANARRLERMLRPLRGRVDLLFERREGDIPQTVPVSIHGVSRDELYERMNAAGFGVVSLYHTLVDPIGRDTFPASHRLSRTILNLPVHQEADEQALSRLVAQLDRETAR
jgi:dTDP-4-amino-4,6-dideoxygalactose transaminase